MSIRLFRKGLLTTVRRYETLPILKLHTYQTVETYNKSTIFSFNHITRQCFMTACYGVLFQYSISRLFYY